MTAGEPPGPDDRDTASTTATGSDDQAGGQSPTDTTTSAGSTGETSAVSSSEPVPGGDRPAAARPADDASSGDPGDPGDGPADRDVSLAAQLAAVADPWRRARMAAQAAEALRHELREVTEVLAETVDALVGRHRDGGPPPADPATAPVDAAAASAAPPGAGDAGPPVDERSPAPSDGSSCRLVELVDPFGVARAVLPWCVGGALHVPRLVVRRLTER